MVTSMRLKNRENREFLASGIILLALCIALCILPSAAGFAADFSTKNLIDHGHFKRARTMLEDQLAKHPKDADSLVLMARVKLAYSQLDEAANILQQAISLEPSNSDAHLYLANTYGREAEKAGWFEKIGLARKVKKELQQATTLDPKNMDALEGMMEFYLEAPGVMGGSGRQAEEMASRILTLDAVRGNLSQGRIASHAKKFAECEAFFQKAVNAAPQSYDALLAVADLYLQDHWNNLDKAAEYADKALGVDPSRVGSYTVLASVLAATDRWRELDELLANSEKRIPDNLVPYFVAGRVLIVKQKDPARAERYLRRYLSQEEPEGETPSFAAAHWRLGLALDRENRREEAVGEIQEAVRMDPSLKQAKIDLARLKSH
jgi:tetratricopeptide (TPR) repeat protein